MEKCDKPLKIRAGQCEFAGPLAENPDEKVMTDAATGLAIENTMLIEKGRIGLDRTAQQRAVGALRPRWQP